MGKSWPNATKNGFRTLNICIFSHILSEEYNLSELMNCSDPGAVIRIKQYLWTKKLGKSGRRHGKCISTRVNAKLCILLGHRNTIQTQYVLHGQGLEAVDHAKYFGLEIGHDLNWNQHIQYTKKEFELFKQNWSTELNNQERANGSRGKLQSYRLF